jgi:hypothetical protein
MMNLALWLKRNGFRADQVQTFYPSPMATATAMYHTLQNPLKGISRDARKADVVDVVKGERRRRLHKAFLRWHDPANWPLLREALTALGRPDLIGNGREQLIPLPRPGERVRSVRMQTAGGDASTGGARAQRPARGTLLTQHTGLPPRPGAALRQPKFPGAKPVRGGPSKGRAAKPGGRKP